MDLKDQLKHLKSEALKDFKSITDPETFFSLQKKYLGRKGQLADIAKEIKNLADDQKPVVGELINSVKGVLEAALDEVKQTVLGAIQELAPGSEVFDPTLPGAATAIGSLHPITQTIFELNDAFKTLGFEVYEGPEISSEGFAFDNLNFPPDHPARESMDTYWIEGATKKAGIDKLCLRPHLTGSSVRYMREHKPPFRFVYPGRVFRSEALDASHERVFYQYEALMVDKDIPFTSGQLLINTILERVFGRSVNTRMRAGFFPFVEPGFEIDMECLVCNGKGCSVCSQTGWVEMMPGGPPHPNVLRAANVDPEQWSGFYINIGLDRIVMMKHGINDIRLFHSGDVRFLEQF